MVEALKLAGEVVVVITELVPEGDPVELAVLLAYLFKVDVVVAMADLVPVEVTVKANEVVKVDEAVELADVAAIVVVELGWEGNPF